MNYELNKNVAVLLAGGSGSRMGADRPKQFLEVKGRTILEWSILAFSRVEEVDEVCIVCRPDWLDYVKELVQKGDYPKVKHILPGGKERYDSSLAAIRAYSSIHNAQCTIHNSSDNMKDAQQSTSHSSLLTPHSSLPTPHSSIRLLLHDSVRPLVSERIIKDCIAALDTYEAVDVAVPSTDTVIQVNEEGVICAIPPRPTLRNVQTPQGFRLETIRRAYELALQDPNFQTTDDCGVVFRYLPETPIKVIAGESTNIKITYPQDLLMMEQSPLLASPIGEENR